MSAGPGTRSVLVIGGMHRSGTSLTAGWLERCGVFLGDELVPADWTNPKGHFEDRAFSDLQRRMLDSAGVSHYCFERHRLQVGPEFDDEARRLLGRRESLPLWGFKDPRTTLLLDYWDRMLPDARYLFVFRHYTRVVDSLVRREQASRWNLRKSWFYLKVWQRYNRDLLAFAEAHPGRCLVLEIEDLLSLSLPALDFMARAWALPLGRVDIAEVADPALLQRREFPAFDLACRAMLPKVRGTYRRLRAHAERCGVLLARGGSA